MEGTPDLASLVSAIMENPSLVEQISALAKSTASAPEPVADHAEPTVTQAQEIPVAQPRKKDRTQLLKAMKPYLSEGRARALDTMVMVADILEGMKGR